MESVLFHIVQVFCGSGSLAALPSTEKAALQHIPAPKKQPSLPQPCSFAINSENRIFFLPGVQDMGGVWRRKGSSYK